MQWLPLSGKFENTGIHGIRLEYHVYQFRLGNNVRVTSQLVFTSRELVTKKAAPV